MGQASPARHPGRLGSRREFSHTIEPSGERATAGCRPGVLAAGGFALTLRLLLAMLRPDMETAKLAQAAADAVDTHELVSLLQQMVRIRSYSAGGEEGTIARFMRDYLITLGLEVDLQEVQPNRFNCISRMPGAGGGTSLMLNGHLDTNPAGEGWTKDPFGGAVDNEGINRIGLTKSKARDAAYGARVEGADAVRGRRSRGSDTATQ